MVDGGKVFKTECGLYVRDKVWNDMYYLGREWVWCNCPYCKRGTECPSAIPYSMFCHCNPAPTDEEYQKEASVENELEKQGNETGAAMQEFYNRYGEKFKRCGYVKYDLKTKRITANAAAIKDCMDCEECAFIKNYSGDGLYKIVCDVKIIERFDKGDMFGKQESITEYIRFELLQQNTYRPREMCERYIKNTKEKQLFERIDYIRLYGTYTYGSIRDVFLAYTPDGYFKSRGWVEGEIIVEHSEPYLIEKGKRKSPQMALLANAAKEAKRLHRLDIYRSRIRKLLKYVPEQGDSERYVESKQRKLHLLSDKYPDIYEEEMKKVEEAERRKKAKTEQIRFY